MFKFDFFIVFNYFSILKDSNDHEEHKGHEENLKNYFIRNSISYLRALRVLRGKIYTTSLGSSIHNNHR